MKRINRITRNEDFTRIIGKRQSVSNRVFVMYYLPNSLDRMRVGISVGKKIGNAVRRNKVKRQLRMMINDLCNFRDSSDLIVIVKPTYNNQSFIENKKDLLQVMKKVKMIEHNILIDKEYFNE